MVTYQEAAEVIRGYDNVLILTHRRPDGDTLGCAVALCLGYRRRGFTAWLHPNEDVTALFDPYLEGMWAPEDFVPEHIVAVDIADAQLFPPSAEKWLGQVDFAFDHHPSHSPFARECCVDPDRAACGELLYDTLLQWGELDTRQAQALYMAIATDTGCFVYTNTTAATHKIAASLMEMAGSVAAINKRHFRTKSRQRLQLESRLMEAMDLYDDGATAISALTLRDMADIGAKEEDAEDIAAFLGQIAGVRTSVTIRELKPGECKLSVRSNGGVNATRVCARLGGGGHAAAAGCTVYDTVEAAKTAIWNAIRREQGK